MWVFQSVHTVENSVYEDWKEKVEQLGAFDGTQDEDYEISVNRKYPIVEAVEGAEINHMGKKYVKVLLNKYAVNLIVQKVTLGTHKRKKGKDRPLEIWQNMRSYITTGKPEPIAVVPENAIDWIPTELKDVYINTDVVDADGSIILDENGNPVKLSDALDAAKAKLDRAKALLTIAASTNII